MSPDDLKTALASAQTTAERLQLLALDAAHRPVGKSAWRSATFWLAAIIALGSLVATVAGFLAGNKTATTVGLIAGAVVAVAQTWKNSADKATDANSATRKLDTVLSANPAPPPGDPAPAPPPVVCSVCGGTRMVYVPGAEGKVTGTKPCPNCNAVGGFDDV